MADGLRPVAERRQSKVGDGFEAVPALEIWDVLGSIAAVSD